MSKTQIDRLGDRLRTGTLSEDDLRELNGYRQGFAPAYRDVIAIVRDRLGIEPTGRPAKSTTAIVDKLRRESIRLSQIQDIAGARLIVPSIKGQDRVVRQIAKAFERTVIIDRRERPSHGYRAVHVIAFIAGAPVEIQVRTALQHLWAELSEKLADVMDPAIKYGGGEPDVRSALTGISAAFADIEHDEHKLLQLESRIKNLRESSPELGRELDDARRNFAAITKRAHAVVNQVMGDIRTIAEGN